MKVAIHKSKWGFSADWIAYCERKNIPFKVVDCTHSDIVRELEDCEVVFWHHHHTLPSDKIFAKQLLFALEHSGKTVFPNFHTDWHFDDKLGQKYLFEALGMQLIPTRVFYSKNEAYQWIKQTKFPKVFKLRNGAGSSHVKLASTRSEARRLVDIAFGRGFESYDRLSDLSDLFGKYRLKKASFKELLKSVRRFFVSTEFARIYGKEKGYVLFQDFIPGNTFDIRIIVIADKAFGMKRMVRKNDFRASGSGLVDYNQMQIDTRCVQMAFKVTRQLNAQCGAFDFVFDAHGHPLIVEVSYGFFTKVYPGYWDESLNWHEGDFNAVEWMMQYVVDEYMGIKR